MTVLFAVGTQLHELTGRADFLALFLASGVAGSLASLSYYTFTKFFATSTLGASGGVAGTVAALALLKPDHTFTFRIPFTSSGEAEGERRKLDVDSRVLLAVLMLAEVPLAVLWRTRADFVAHLGGYAGGILGAVLLRWRTKAYGHGSEEGVGEATVREGGGGSG